MKLYSCKIAPNARKLILYLKEKNILSRLDVIEIDLISGEQYKDKYQSINSLGKVPVLELDDGSVIQESLSIIEYFEELNPAPSLTGKSPEDRAKIKAIERFIDFEIMGTMGIIAHQIMPLFESRFEQSKATINYGRARQTEALEYLEQFISDGLYVYGNEISIADITLFVTFEKAYQLKAAIDPKYINIIRVIENFARRPSIHY